MSKNNIFYDFEEEVYCRYKKAVPTMVSGKRRNPYKTEEVIDFVLKTDPRDFNFDKIGKEASFRDQVTFNYDSEVLEVYSEKEDKFIRRANASFFERGMLVPYVEHRPEFVTPNDLSDTDVYEIASAKNIFQFKKALKDITSDVTLQRVLDAVKEKNRPVSFVNAVVERIEEVVEEPEHKLEQREY
jgi:hypothetical protein